MNRLNHWIWIALLTSVILGGATDPCRAQDNDAATAATATEADAPPPSDDDASATTVQPAEDEGADSGTTGDATADDGASDGGDPERSADDGATKPKEATSDDDATDPAAGTGPAGAAAPTTSDGMSPWIIFFMLAALFVLPVLLGNYIAGILKMPDHGWKISLALGSLAAAAVVISFGQLRGGPDLVGGIILVYELEDPSELVDPEDGGPTPDDEDAPRRRVKMDDLINALTKRVNPGGTKEVTIRQYGVDQIEIIIPKAGEADLARIKNEITALGELEFRITAAEEQPADLPIIKAARALNPLQKEAEYEGRKAKWVAYSPTEFGPVDQPDIRVVKRLGKDRAGQDVPEVLVLLDSYNVTGEYLVRASPGVGNEGINPAVNFLFDSNGANRFARLTGANLPDRRADRYRHLGIVLNRRLESAPRINEKIGARGIIEGNFTQEEVESLVNILNAGSLPAALNTTPISEETISPTLGALTIEKGKIAIGISLTGVLVFMLFYYHFAGIVACLALGANLLLIVGLMVLVKAAFTLPGLAGLVLTVGMSVDANVLIFERIREELTRGAALRMAIRNGFGRATRTIVDANLTTLITGVVLFWIGTDQIKGFAVTLILGIVMSMYTAIFCSRIIFDIAERRRWISELKMRRIIGHTHFNFLGREKIAATCSIALIIIGLVAAFSRGTGLLNIDFTGGASVTMVLKEEHAMSQGEVRELLARTELGQKNLSVVQRGEDRRRYTINARFETPKGEKASGKKPTGPSPVQVVERIIRETFDDMLETHSVTATPLIPLADAAAISKSRRAVVADAVRSTGDDPDDSFVIEYDPTGRTLTPVAYQEETEDADATSAAPTTDEVAPPAAQPAEADDESASPETTAADPPETGDATVSDVPSDRFLSETNLTFDDPVAFDTVANWMDELLREHTGREAFFQLTNPDHVAGSGTLHDTWTVQLPLPVAEATPLLAKFQDELNSRPLFPLSNEIGGRVAERMQQLAALSIVFSLICIVGYIWLRFQRVEFGLAAVVALVHDVLVTLGMIAVSAYIVDFASPFASLLRIESFQISLPIVAAFMTIIGYSLNDTIVVFDRIREVRGKSPDLTGEMVNTSINQTLSRTLLTSLTTFIVVVILYFVGGAGIHGFAFALVIGVLVGTYSSIFVASPVLLWMSTPRKKVAARA